MSAPAPQLTLIPIAQIDVLNPRERNRRVFEQIIGNIQQIGLKKPVTVTPRTAPDGTTRYLLVCGEGRLTAFQRLGETTIPALVVEVGDEDAFIMSLAENIARRPCSGLESLAGIDTLRQQGYGADVIATKTGLTARHVHDILALLASGEERLLDAVEKGRLPIAAAVTIARAGSDTTAIQNALQDAYESGALRGSQLKEARRVIERREQLGRSLRRSGSGHRRASEVTAHSLVRTYQKEVERQKQMVRKAEFAQQRLLFVVGALRQLFDDEHFVTLLRAEGLDNAPRYLAERVNKTGALA